MWPMKKIMHFCKLSDNALRSKEMTNDDFFVSLFYCYLSTTWQEEEAHHVEVDVGFLAY